MDITSKSYLAKLLATEDVSIEHRNVPTAYFDLKSRKIVLPNWKDMPDFLYDLLIGHEVGHALVTPAEGWHSASSSKGANFKSFLNVVEDVRNERLVKLRYPGLVKSFYKGYQMLYKKDFFGLSKLQKTPQELPLIDRINLHAKVGAFLTLQFTAEEQVILDKCFAAETWDEVVAIAEELYDFSKTEDAMQDLLDEQMGGPLVPKTPSRPSTPPSPPSGGGGGGGPVEVHMVYGEWCGHSKRAKPDFQELVNDNSVKTGSGSPVKFVMTTDDSPGMEQFKGKVRGFPTYMVVKSNGEMEELQGHDRTKDSIKSAVASLN